MDRHTTNPLNTGLSPEEQVQLDRFHSGENEAFHKLMRPHLAPLRALAVRVCGDPHWADDLLQETLVRVFRGLGGFRGESSLRTWSIRILVRLASEPQRWKRGGKETSIEFEVPEAWGPSPEDVYRDRELQDRLQESLERLTERQRSAFHLRAVEGMDYRAIAAVLDCTAAAARMLVLEARRRVMERMGRHLEP